MWVYTYSYNRSPIGQIYKLPNRKVSQKFTLNHWRYRNIMIIRKWCLQWKLFRFNYNFSSYIFSNISYQKVE